MGALYNQHASQCLKIVWLGLLVFTPTISLFRSTLVVLHYFLMYAQPLFRVLRTVLSSHWIQLGRVITFRVFSCLDKILKGIQEHLKLPFKWLHWLWTAWLRLCICCKCFKWNVLKIYLCPHLDLHPARPFLKMKSPTPHPLTLKFHKHNWKVSVNNQY